MASRLFVTLRETQIGYIKEQENENYSYSKQFQVNNLFFNLQLLYLYNYLCALHSSKTH